MPRKKTDEQNDETPQELGLQGQGVERVSIPAIDLAVKTYKKHRDKRIDVLELEVQAKANLTAILHENADQIRGGDGVLRYRTDTDQMVELIPGKEKVKVRDADDNGEDED